jgi:adenosylhomocysteine nucleosidase
MTIAIVGAMREELAPCADARRGKQQAAGRVLVAICMGRKWWLLAHRQVAATTATALIERSRPGASCSPASPEAGQEWRSAMVVRQFLQHDLDASPIFPRYEVPLYGTSYFATDPLLTGQLARAARAALPRVVLHRGLVVSGDRFVSTTAESQTLQLALPQALAVEMEGAAIAQVCHDYGIPFAAVRTISDRADDEAHVDFTRFIQEVASRHSAAVVEALLRG